MAEVEGFLPGLAMTPVLRRPTRNIRLRNDVGTTGQLGGPPPKPARAPASPMARNSRFQSRFPVGRHFQATGVDHHAEQGRQRQREGVGDLCGDGGPVHPGRILEGDRGPELRVRSRP